jgi:serine/threonine-protein kinase RsbW
MPTKQWQMQLRSEPKNITQIEPLIEEIKKVLRLSDDDEGTLGIALSEAVNNAILHGNNSQPDKLVKININHLNGKLMITVMDEGIGFTDDSKVDPTDPENLLKTSGRGLFLMRQMMQNVAVTSTDEGTTLTMEMTINAS